MTCGTSMQITTFATSSPGGGSGVESYTEVATLSALQANLANGARLLVADDIAMSGTETVSLTSITSLTIAIKDGKTLSHSGSADIFSAASGTCRLTIETGPRSGASPAIVVSGTGKVADSSGVMIIDWRNRLHIDGPSGAWTPFGTGAKLDGGDLTIDAGNGLITLGYGYGKIRSLLANGGGSSCAVLLRVGCGPIVFRGEFRSYSGSASGTYALRVKSAFNPTMSPAGPIQFDTTGYTYTPCVYADGLVEIFGVQGTDNTYVPRVALSDLSVCRASRIVPVFLNTTHPGSFSQCYLLGAVFDSSAKAGDIIGCDFALGTTTTFPSGSKPRIHGGRCIGTVVFQSGSEPVVTGFGNLGTITIDSGAGGRFTGLQDGGGTFTNNDPLSIVTGSDDVRRDTTPATRAFADSSGAQSATLNTELLPFIVGYWDCVTLPAPNRGPGLPSCSAGPILDMSTARTVMASSAGLDSGAGTAVWRASMPIYTGAGDFTFSCYHNPDDATPASETHILTAGTTNGLDLLASGALRIYLNGGVILDSSTGVLSDGVESRITYLRRNNAGTPTIYIYVDGVEVGSVANSTVVNPSDYFGNTNGTYANPGVTRRAIVANCGISEATENLLDTYWLQGAGNA